MQKTFTLFNQSKVDGYVNADIIYIKSENDAEFAKDLRKYNGEWRKRTKGKYIELQGVGMHAFMMREQSGKENGTILNNYIKESSNEQ